VLRKISSLPPEQHARARTAVQQAIEQLKSCGAEQYIPKQILDTFNDQGGNYGVAAAVIKEAEPLPLAAAAAAAAVAVTSPSS